MFRLVQRARNDRLNRKLIVFLFVLFVLFVVRKIESERVVGIEIAVRILAPFPDIPVHVVQPPRVLCKTADWRGCHEAVLGLNSVFPIVLGLRGSIGNITYAR